jgi:class 3 adenylate cyclase
MQYKAIRIYWIGSFLALIEASLLLILGLDLSAQQIRILPFVLLIPAIIMYLCDRWLIIRHTRPIDAVWQRLHDGETVSPDAVQTAYVHTLNLPILTLLRVLTIHAPAILMPATLFGLAANWLVDLHFTWWQFFISWCLWPITSAPHAIVEYFLIDRVVRGVLSQFAATQDVPIAVTVPQAAWREVMQLLLGRSPEAPPVIRLSTGVQLSWLLVFVSLMPMLVLGASIYLKLATANATDSAAQTLRMLGLWIGFLIALNTAISAAIVTLMAHRVRNSMHEFLGHMERVLQGDLSQLWNPRTTDEFLDLGSGFNAMVAGLREREAIKDTFGRFVSQDVAAAVLENRVPLQGELREVTVLFQDIRGFTSLSEHTSPVILLHMLNGFFTEMVAAVEAHGGTVKQFTGDGLMALFSAPVQHGEEPIRAVRAALTMLERLDTFNQHRLQGGEAALRIGVGIHTGEVVAGNIGPDTRMEYGVVGDAVNVASRVQGLTKEVGAAILVTDVTAARLEERFLFGKQAVLPVRGKTEPIQVIEILKHAPLMHEGR